MQITKKNIYNKIAYILILIFEINYFEKIKCDAEKEIESLIKKRSTNIYGINITSDLLNHKSILKVMLQPLQINKNDNNNKVENYYFIQSPLRKLIKKSSVQNEKSNTMYISNEMGNAEANMSGSNNFHLDNRGLFINHSQINESLRPTTIIIKNVPFTNATPRPLSCKIKPSGGPCNKAIAR